MKVASLQFIRRTKKRNIEMFIKEMQGVLFKIENASLNFTGI